MKRLGLVAFFLVCAFAQSAALAEEAVLCTKGGCQKITLKPGCKIVHGAQGKEHVSCRLGAE